MGSFKVARLSKLCTIYVSWEGRSLDSLEAYAWNCRSQGNRFAAPRSFGYGVRQGRVQSLTSVTFTISLTTDALRDSENGNGFIARFISFD